MLCCKKVRNGSYVPTFQKLGPFLCILRLMVNSQDSSDWLVNKAGGAIVGVEHKPSEGFHQSVCLAVGPRTATSCVSVTPERGTLMVWNQPTQNNVLHLHTKHGEHLSSYTPSKRAWIWSCPQLLICINASILRKILLKLMKSEVPDDINKTT